MRGSSVGMTVGLVRDAGSRIACCVMGIACLAFGVGLWIPAFAGMTKGRE